MIIIIIIFSIVDSAMDSTAFTVVFWGLLVLCFMVIHGPDSHSGIVVHHHKQQQSSVPLSLQTTTTTTTLSSSSSSSFAKGPG